MLAGVKNRRAPFLSRNFLYHVGVSTQITRLPKAWQVGEPWTIAEAGELGESHPGGVALALLLILVLDAVLAALGYGEQVAGSNSNEVIEMLERGEISLGEELVTADLVKLVSGDGRKVVLPSEVPIMKKLRRKDTL